VSKFILNYRQLSPIGGSSVLRDEPGRQMLSQFQSQTDRSPTNQPAGLQGRGVFRHNYYTRLLLLLQLRIVHLVVSSVCKGKATAWTFTPLHQSSQERTEKCWAPSDFIHPRTANSNCKRSLGHDTNATTKTLNLTLHWSAPAAYRHFYVVWILLHRVKGYYLLFSLPA
jgi:hypothetical protein